MGLLNVDYYLRHYELEVGLGDMVMQIGGTYVSLSAAKQIIRNAIKDYEEIEEGKKNLSRIHLGLSPNSSVQYAGALERRVEKLLYNIFCYQVAVNKIDDAFEYAYGDEKSREKLHSILAELTSKLEGAK